MAWGAWSLRRRLGVLLASGALTLVAGLGGGLALERHDPFCASCHTEPETTYVRQAHGAPDTGPVTLAAYHGRLEPAVRCIDCHGGVGPVAQVATLVDLGVVDALKFVTGRYAQPARTEHPLPNINCAQCHAAALQAPGFDNHFHNKLTEEGAPALLCVACHVSHTDRVDPREMFISRAAVFPQCNDCHRVMGGPTTLR